MNKDLTAICILIDGSTSMREIKKGVISGFNEFVETQKEVPGKAVLSMYQFSSDYYGTIPKYITPRHKHVANEFLNFKTIYHFMDLKEIKNLNNESYSPEGNTPLLDAMSRAIDEFGADLARIPEKDRPSKVIFVAMTDGEENSSRVTNNEQLLEKVKHQSEKYDWQFVFLGANIDSFSTAGQYGISMKSTSNFQYSNAGMMRAMSATSDSLTQYRSGNSLNVDLTSFSKDEQDKIDLVKPPGGAASK